MAQQNLTIALMIALLAVFYLLPTIFAFVARAPARWLVLLINVLFGWTIGGYIVAFVLGAVSSGHRKAMMAKGTYRA